MAQGTTHRWGRPHQLPGETATKNADLLTTSKCLSNLFCFTNDPEPIDSLCLMAHCRICVCYCMYACITPPIQAILCIVVVHVLCLFILSVIRVMGWFIKTVVHVLGLFKQNDPKPIDYLPQRARCEYSILFDTLYE
jgi:hypothetical protein